MFVQELVEKLQACDPQTQIVLAVGFNESPISTITNEKTKHGTLYVCLHGLQSLDDWTPDTV